MTTVAVALAAIASVIMAEFKGTKRHAADAQLRQLLHPGALVTHEKIGTSTEQSHLTLAEHLVEDCASVTVQFEPTAEDNAASVKVVATLGDHEAMQTLRFIFINGKWEVVTAELG